MVISEAIAKVKAYGAQHGIEGFLEILTDMEVNYSDLNEQETLAYRVTMRAGQEMFAPVDA
jgi:hypothetical protein